MPLTAQRPDLSKLVADKLGVSVGSLLINVNTEVKVLSKASITPTEQLSLNMSEAKEKLQLREAA